MSMCRVYACLMLLAMPALKPPPTATHCVASGDGCCVRLICTASECWQGWTAATGSGCAAGLCPDERHCCVQLPHTAPRQPVCGVLIAQRLNQQSLRTSIVTFVVLLVLPGHSVQTCRMQP